MRVLIVEDLPPVAKSLERAVRGFFDTRPPRPGEGRRGARLRAIDRVADLAAAKAFLERSEIDLLLLDLDLGGEDGFEILRWAVAGSFHTLVVSANTHRALEAFEHGVLDFVPKPAEPARLARALERAVGDLSDPGARTAQLWVRRRGGIVRVPVAAVRFVSGAGKYAELHLEDGRRLLHEKSLARLTAVLPATFLRVHRSFLVDLGRVAELRIQGGGRYSLRLDDGTEIPVGRSRYGELRGRLSSSRDTQRPASTR